MTLDLARNSQGERVPKTPFFTRAQSMAGAAIHFAAIAGKTQAGFVWGCMREVLI